MIEPRLREASEAWFPPTPSVAAAVRSRLPAVPDAGRGAAPRRRVLVIALAALALTGTALAASVLDLVPGVRVQHVEELPELPFTDPPSFGAASTLEEARRALPFEPVLPDSLGDPDQVFLDRDLGGAPIVTAVYGSPDGARLVLTQWPAESVLFHKLLMYDASARFVDVHGASVRRSRGGSIRRTPAARATARWSSACGRSRRPARRPRSTAGGAIAGDFAADPVTRWARCRIC